MKMGEIIYKSKNGNYVILHIEFEGTTYYDKILSKDCTVEIGDEYDITGLFSLIEIARKNK